MKLFQSNINNPWTFLSTKSPFLSQGKKLTSAIVHSANSNAAKQNQIFQQKKDALFLSDQSSTANKSYNVIYTNGWEPEDLAPEKIPGYVSSQMKNYRDQIGSTADNLNHYKDQISYLKDKIGEMEKLKNGQFSDDILSEIKSYESRYVTEQDWQKFQDEYKSFLQQEAESKLNSYKQQLEKSCRDVEDVLKTRLDMASGYVNAGQMFYGDKVFEKVTDAMGNYLNAIKGDDFKLNTAGKTADETMSAIDETVGKLKDLADKITSGYEDYTGKKLDSYEYQTGELTSEAKEQIDQNYMLTRELGQSRDPRLQISGVDSIHISLDNLKPAENSLGKMV